MTQEKIDKWLLDLEPFSLSELHTAMALLKHYLFLGYSLVEQEAFYSEILAGDHRKKIKELVARQRLYRSKEKPCPLCEAPLSIYSINEPKGKSNVKGYASLWLCPNADCPFEEFSFNSKYEEKRMLLTKEET